MVICKDWVTRTTKNGDYSTCVYVCASAHQCGLTVPHYVKNMLIILVGLQSKVMMHWKIMIMTDKDGTQWCRGMFCAFSALQPKGRGFESTSHHCIATLDKLLTHNCL